MCCFFSASAKPTLLWNIRWWVFWRLRSRLVWRLNHDISILVFQMHLLYHHPSMNRTIYFNLLVFPFDQFNYFFWLNFYNNTFNYSIESKFYSRDESILNFYSWYCTTDALAFMPVWINTQSITNNRCFKVFDLVVIELAFKVQLI